MGDSDQLNWINAGWRKSHGTNFHIDDLLRVNWANSFGLKPQQGLLIECLVCFGKSTILVNRALKLQSRKCSKCGNISTFHMNNFGEISVKTEIGIYKYVAGKDGEATQRTTVFKNK